ncbi:MAG: tetratricopeptide repeat protein, partial [Gemmatimonadaceae bacterium]
VGAASVHMDAKRFARAEALYREGLAIRRKSLPAGHRYIGETLSDLGDCLMAQRRYREAGMLLAEALELLRQAEGEDASRTKRARARVAELEKMAPGVTQAGRPQS